MIFYFSGTGNSKWVAEELADRLDDKAIPVMHAKEAYQLAENEKIGFVFPIYAWSAPACVFDLIGRVHFDNYRQNYTYFVCTCHSQAGAIDDLMRRALMARGLSCDAGFSLNMPNNYLAGPFMHADSDKKKIRMVAQAQIRIEEIETSIRNTEKTFRLSRGPFAKMMSHFGPKLFKKMLNIDKFRATDDCNRCGTCASSCPTRNIKVEHKPSWGKNCEMCLSCLNRCPQQAILYGRFTKNKKRYVFSKDLLKD